ncbi:hypothetical protein [Anaerotignum sp.]
MSDKVTRIPITHKQRDINLHGFGYVPCEITGRYLQFDKTYCKENNLVFVDVMAADTNSDSPRKLCQLCLDIALLKKVINEIQPE